MACGQSVTKNLKKRSIRSFLKTQNHEDGPEGEAMEKKLPFRGRPIMMPVVREATTGVFFVFSMARINSFCRPNGKIVRLKAIFHLASDWKNARPNIKAKTCSTALFNRLFLRMANLLALIRPTRALRHPVPGKSQPAYSERLTMRQDALPVLAK